MQQNCSEYGDVCSSVIYQTVDVGLPISLMPSVNMGDIKILCCGEPRVEYCEVGRGCGGVELRVTQTVTYKIPIAYGVEASSGNATTEVKKNYPNANCAQYR